METKHQILLKYFLILFLSIGIFTIQSLAQDNGQPFSKSNLKIFIQYKLAKAKLLINDNIKVDINDNKIILSGTVPTIYDKNQA